MYVISMDLDFLFEHLNSKSIYLPYYQSTNSLRTHSQIITQQKNFLCLVLFFQFVDCSIIFLEYLSGVF